MNISDDFEASFTIVSDNDHSDRMDAPPAITMLSLDCWLEEEDNEVPEVIAMPSEPAKPVAVKTEKKVPAASSTAKSRPVARRWNQNTQAAARPVQSAAINHRR